MSIKQILLNAISQVDDESGLAYIKLREPTPPPPDSKRTMKKTIDLSTIPSLGIEDGPTVIIDIDHSNQIVGIEILSY